LGKALTSAILLLLFVTLRAGAQQNNPAASAASPEETFSFLHEALSAKATNLLTSAQRLPETQPSKPRDAAELVSSPGSSLQAEAQSGQANLLERKLARVQALLPLVEPILREEGIPLQLAAVILVESGGQTMALSPKGARGLWQLMPGTARRYGLVVARAIDERLDPIKSTRAAARYLRDLNSQFGNWPLALAAYNAGEDTVQRAVDRFPSREFASLAHAGVLPLETRNYVLAVLSAFGMMQADTGRHWATKSGSPAVWSIVYAASESEK
jgi:hypothetical protein